MKAVAAILSKDYVDLKIDTDRMKNGKAVAMRLRGSNRGGIPWMVILEPDGKAVINSDGPKGNVGCPVEPHERAYFIKMLQKSRNRMTDADIAVVQKQLKAFAEKLR